MCEACGCQAKPDEGETHDEQEQQDEQPEQPPK